MNKLELSLRRGMFRRWMATPPVPSSSGRYQPGLFSEAAKSIEHVKLIQKHVYCNSHLSLENKTQIKHWHSRELKLRPKQQQMLKANELYTVETRGDVKRHISRSAGVQMAGCCRIPLVLRAMPSLTVSESTFCTMGCHFAHFMIMQKRQPLP